MGKQKCKVCGCTEKKACTDKNGVGCYWAEPNLCSNCKEFVFFHSKDGKSKPIKITKKESELTKQDENLLYGEIVNVWNNNTKMNRDRFLNMLFEEMKKNQPEIKKVK